MKTADKTNRYVLFAVIIAILTAAYFTLFRTGTVHFLEDSNALKQWFQNLGLVGPMAIISLMAMAIIMSPVPSAPIALAAGAVYGHSAGTI